MEHPDPDLLALAALPAERRDTEVEAHLVVCRLCRGHVDALRRTVDLALNSDDALRSTTPGDDAPPDRVWRAITEELGTVPERRVTRRPAWRRFALPVAAAVIGVAAGLGIGVAVDAQPAAGSAVARLAPVTSVDQGGSGTVDMVTGDGRRQMVIELAGITDVAGGDFLEAWLMDPTGTRLVALGSLAQDGTTFRGSFTVPADLPTTEFDTVDISAEKWDGNPGHSRISLLRGSVA